MRRLFLTILVLIVTGGSLFSADIPNDPEAFCQGYLDAIQSGSWERAREFWLPREVAKSQRLGITYQGISAKYDCASSLITNYEKMAAGLIEISIDNIKLEGNEAKFDIRQAYKSDTLLTRYYAQKIDGRWYLVSSMYANTRGWKKYATRFANVFCHDTSLINDYALGMLDDFISSTGKMFGIDSERMSLLEKEKIDYYLCSENEFKKLTGYDAHGITNLPFDAIITRHLPHTHELTHFMINYALKDLPLYTLPVLQEGLAVDHGGRWGKSPAVLDQLGYVLLKNQYCSLNELLTFDNFNIDLGMPDISYPVSGLFVDYLIDKKGMENFKQLYLELSGSYNHLRSWNKEHIISVFENYLGMDWISIQSDFTSFCQRYEKGDIYSTSKDIQDQPSNVLDRNGSHLKIYEAADEYYFVLDSLPDTTWAVLLFIDPDEKVSSTYQSGLFYEQFSTGAYRGQKYGLRFNSDEAGLYDYYTDIMIAKYIRSFDPDSHYWSPDSGTVRFTMKKALLPKPIENYDLKFSI